MKASVSDMPFCYYCEDVARYRTQFDKFLCDACFHAEMELLRSHQKLKEWGVVQ